MSFIGILSESKVFENIKPKLVELAGLNKFNVILINSKSIENVKNISFEVIVIDSDLNKIENIEMLKVLCKKAKYVFFNTDINKIINEFDEKKLITYGLNQNALITVSSITESDILIFIQKKIKTKQNKIIEIEEKRLKLNEKCKLKIYEILILYTIFLLYDDNLIEEI